MNSTLASYLSKLVTGATIIVFVALCGSHFLDMHMAQHDANAAAAWTQTQQSGADAIRSLHEEHEALQGRINQLNADIRKERAAAIDDQASSLEATARIAARTKRIQHATDCENAITGGLELPASCK